MPVPFLDLPGQYQNLKQEIDAALQSVISRGAFAGGPFVEEFEKKFADFCGVQHCIGLHSGTAALTLLLQAYDIGPRDEVIVPVNTFIATAEAVSILGASPIFVDCEESSGLIDVSKIEAKVSQKTKAIIPVHLYGQPADMEEILNIAKRHNLLVFEDACQAHGALYKSKSMGSLTHGAAFSFYPGKNLGAFGEAGAVTTNDPTIAHTICMLREHGQSSKYHHDLVGWNERMDGIQGAVLLVKLTHLKAWNEKRRSIAARYKKELLGVGDIRFITEKPDRTPIYHLLVLRTAKRDALQEYLKKHDIQTGIHYPVPLHLTKAYAHLSYKKGDFPIAEHLTQEILSLPMFPEMKEEQIEEVCTAIKNFF